VLVLDGVIQASERDEFAYQEMITHVALNSHPHPRRILVVGGGDGGVLREIVKHDTVECAELVEIDEAVIRVSKLYLPEMAKGFDSSKVKVHLTDGYKFLEIVKNKYDVIISDSSDPQGPAELLFQKSFFELMSNALTEDGIFIMQASENIWLKLNVLRILKLACKQVFPMVEYTHTCVPTYTSGQLGLMICSKNPNHNLRIPLRTWTDEEESKLCRYYNKEIHQTSFELATFARKVLDAV
jgi:spermidine synthase